MSGYKPSATTHFVNSEWEAKQLIPALTKQLEADAKNAALLCNLGNSYYTTGETERAIELFREAHLLAPDNAAICCNLGIALADHVKFDEAYGYVEKANRLDPTDRYAASVYAEFLLRNGQWAMGWDLYERCRFSIPDCPLPKYTGGSLQGARILVLQEGGSGDVFMAFRFFKNLREMAPDKITFAVDKQLHCVFENHPWVDNLIEADGVKILLSDYDCYVSSFSLTPIFAHTPDRVPWPGAYLKGEVDVKRIVGNKLKVGLCWMAGEWDENRPHRTLSEKNLDMLLTNILIRENVKWYSLQKDWPTPSGMEQLNLETWETTAEEIDALDLVISVDTGVMHLAGAIGKPVWTLLSNSCWRFLREGEACVWYPTMRLFRNRERGYDQAVEKVAEELRRLV